MLKSVKDNFNTYSEIKKEYDDLEKAKSSGRYSPQYINDTIRPKQFKIHLQLNELQGKANSEVKKLVEEMRTYLRGLDALNPDEITDDIKLLNCGIPLKKNDIQAILERNKGNRTMTQLALRYCKENGMDDVKIYYQPAEEQMRGYEGAASAAGVVIKWYDNPRGFESMYSQCLGEGSDMYNHYMSEE
jgi:hypothetical protein